MSYNLTTLYTGLNPIRLASLISYSWVCHEMPGCFAEFGVMKAGSLELLAKIHPDRKIYGIDGFNGLPEPSLEDVHMKGDFALTETEYNDLVLFFAATYNKVEIIAGYSPDVFTFIPSDTTYSFIHCDVDLYSSVNDALDYFFPRLLPDGIMLFDDYGFDTTPGAKKAIDEWQGECKYRGAVYLHGIGLTGQYIIVK